MNRLKKFHNQFYSSYILNGDEKGNSLEKISSLWKETGKEMIVLDLGCGAGVISSELVKRGHEIYGIDIQTEAIHRANLRGLKAQVHDINNGIPFEDKTFDVVIAMDILEHLFDPLYILNEMRRVLKDNGYVITMIPLHFDIVQRLRILLGKGIITYEHLQYCVDYKPWNYVHIRFFTLKEVYEFIEKENFTIERKEFRPVMRSNLFLPTRIFLKICSNIHIINALPTLFSSGVKMRLVKK